MCVWKNLARGTIDISSLPVVTVHFLSDTSSILACLRYMLMFPKDKKGHATTKHL